MPSSWQPPTLGKAFPSYEVRRVHGNYKGIDSADISDTSNLRLDSPVHDANLLLSVYHRHDMEVLLQRMVKKGMIPATYAKECILAAKNMFYDVPRGVREDIHAVYEHFKMPIEKALEGATSISFIDSIILERNLANSLSCKDLYHK